MAITQMAPFDKANRCGHNVYPHAKRGPSRGEIEGGKQHRARTAHHYRHLAGLIVVYLLVGLALDGLGLTRKRCSGNVTEDSIPSRSVASEGSMGVLVCILCYFWIGSRVSGVVEARRAVFAVFLTMGVINRHTLFFL